MNPLTELHERLAYSAVAGTALLEDDFRLKKLMDAFAPLAQKNPVFAKIYSELQQLFGAEEAQRGKLLLNLLGLVDAVLYTQAGYGVEGEFAALPHSVELAEVRQIRYSALNPLITALTTTGSGRMEVLRDTISDHAEYLCDYRVLYALICDLGDPYGEMATLIFDVLKAFGTGQTVETYGILNGIHQQISYVLPEVDKKQLVSQLKRGFDPEGKTDMAKRLMLVSIIAGADENDWYLSLLDTAKKDIRALTVFALGKKEENIPLLMELAKKERGKVKEMAYRALAQWDTPETVTFWETALDKNAKLAEYLSSTTLDVYGDMAAKHLQEELSKILDEPHIERKQMDETISPWIAALTGKASEGVIHLYQWISERRTRIPKIRDMMYNKKVKSYALFPLIYEKICEALVMHCPQKLVDFLQDKRDIYLQEACFLADILTLPAAEVYDRWNTTKGDVLSSWFQRIISKTGQSYVIRTVSNMSILSVDGAEIVEHICKEPLDLRWFDVFMKNDWENMFAKISLDLPDEWRKKIGAYFYQKALRIEKDYNIYYRLYDLRQKMAQMCLYGCETFDGILVSLCKSYPNIPGYQLQEAFAQYQTYAGAESTECEAERVLEFYGTAPEGGMTVDTVSKLLKENGFLKQ